MSWTIRRAAVGDALTLAEVNIAAWRQAYPGIVPAPVLERLSPERRAGAFAEQLGGDGVAAFLVEDAAGVPAGVAIAGPRRTGPPDHPGEFRALYLLQAAQRQGLGRLLMTAMTAWLTEQALWPAVVWTFRDNLRARRFYERLGAKLCDAGEVHFDGGFVVPEVCYSVADAVAFAGRTPVASIPR